MSKHTFVHQEIELEALKSLLGSKWRSPRLGYAMKVRREVDGERQVSTP